MHVFAWTFNSLGIQIFLNRTALIWSNASLDLRFSILFHSYYVFENSDLFFLSQIWSMQSNDVHFRCVLCSSLHQNSCPIVEHKIPTSERGFCFFHNHNKNRIDGILIWVFFSIVTESLVNVLGTSERTAHRMHTRWEAHKRMWFKLHCTVVYLLLQATVLYTFSVRPKIAVQLSWSLTYLIFHASQISFVRFALAVCVFVCMCACRYAPPDDDALISRLVEFLCHFRVSRCKIWSNHLIGTQWRFTTLSA